MPRQLEVMGTAEAADYLGVHKESISRMIRHGRLKPDVHLQCGPIFRRRTIERIEAEWQKQNPSNT